MADEIFDPEIHATDPKTGEPSLNKDGSFRKKRKDAGARKTAAPKTSSGGGNSTRDRYKKNVDQFLGVPVTLLSIKDPVLGFAASELAPMWSEGLADLAVDYPQLAAALDRAGNLGSAAGLLGAALMTGVQIGNLMGKVPDHMAKMMGARTRPEIEQILQQRGVQLAEQSQRQAAEAEQHGQAEAEKAWDTMPVGAREHAHV